MPLEFLPAATRSGSPRPAARTPAARTSDSLLQPQGLRQTYGNGSQSLSPAAAGAAKSVMAAGKDGAPSQPNAGAVPSVSVSKQALGSGKGVAAAPLLINAYAAAGSRTGSTHNGPGSPRHSGRHQGENRSWLSRMFPRR